MKKSSDNKMGTMPMLPLVLSMSLPAMFSMIIQALYNVVDSIFISQFDEQVLHSGKAFYAVSLAFPMQMVAISFGVGTAIGVNSLIARRLGAGNRDEASSAATHGLMLGVANWVLFLVLGLLLSGRFIALFTGDSETIGYGTSYLTIVLSASLGMMVSSMCEKMLQATGNMIIPMLTQLLGAVINIILDPLLIFGYGFFPQMGVVGAAVATVFGQFCSMAFVLIVLFKKDHEIKITFRGFRPSKTIIKNIYAVGFPAIVMQSIGSVMVSGINAIISMAQVDPETAKAYTSSFGIYFKLQSFIFMPVFGLNQGVSPIIGYNYGARNKKRLYAAFRMGLLFAVLIMAAGTLVFQLAPEWLVSLFGSDPKLMEVAVPTFRIISLSFMLASLGIMFSTMFQAVGKGIYSMIMSFSRQLVVLLPVALLLSKIDLTTMFYAFPIAEIASLVLAIVFFALLRRKELRYLDEPAG